MPFLGVDPAPGVDPFVGWVLGGLVAAVLAQAAVVYKMATYIATSGLEREKALATIASHDADVIEQNTAAWERVSEFMEKK